MEDVAAARADFIKRALEQRLMIATGIPGVYGRGAVLHDLIGRIEALIDPYCRKEGAERMFFPPLTPRETLRKVGYMDNFPQLCGSVHAFSGDGAAHLKLIKSVNAGDDWGEHLRQTDVVLTPAACYPLYPTITGTLPKGGKVYDFTAFCFRHEPSDDPARMQSFQVRENVRAGTPEEVQEWRGVWKERGKMLLEQLGVPVRLETATDPFFGRAGKLMKANQEALALKFELLMPIWSEESPTAVASFNYHQEHFGQVFEIRSFNGEIAHTACLGFGLDRIAVGLLKHHGFDTERWPSAVRQRLWP
jgi:seryl-tRNA synthetase